MANAHKADLEIRAKVIGADRALRDFRKITNVAKDSGLNRNLGEMEALFTRIVNAIEAGGTATKSFKKDLAALEKATAAVHRIERARDKDTRDRVRIEREHHRQAQARARDRRSITQGFMQGSRLGVGPLGRGGKFAGGFIAGRLAGAGLKLVSASATAPFRQNGLVGLMGQIPLVGGILGPQTEAMLNQGAQARTFAASLQRLQQTSATRFAGSDAVEQRRIAAKAASQSLRQVQTSGTLAPPGVLGLPVMAYQRWQSRGQRDAAQASADASRAAYERAKRADARTRYRGHVRQLAERFGLSPSSLAESLSGGFGEAGSNLTSAFGFGTAEAIAGGRALGVSGNTTGLLAHGLHMQGAKGTNAVPQALADLYTDAVAAGLDGSEVHKYIQQTAEELASFRTSGMPLDVRSVGAFASALSSTVGASRAAAMGRNVRAGMRGIVSGGPQSYADIIAMQPFLGSGPVTGSSLTGAFKQMETGQGAAQAVQHMISTVKGQSAGSYGPLLFAQMYRQRFGDIGMAEAEKLFNTGVGPGTTFGSRPTLDTIARGADVMDPNLQRYNKLLSDQLASGERVLETSESLLRAQQNNIEALSRLSRAFEETATSFEETTAKLDATISSWTTRP